MEGTVDEREVFEMGDEWKLTQPRAFVRRELRPCVPQSLDRGRRNSQTRPCHRPHAPGIVIADDGARVQPAYALHAFGGTRPVADDVAQAYKPRRAAMTGVGHDGFERDQVGVDVGEYGDLHGRVGSVGFERVLVA
jgi:hypothetical protein